MKSLNWHLMKCLSFSNVLKIWTWSSLPSSGDTAPLKAAAAASQEAEVSSSNSRSRSKALWGVLTK